MEYSKIFHQCKLLLLTGWSTRLSCGKSCANRNTSRPIGNPEPRSCAPLDTPFFLHTAVPQPHKCRLAPVRRKNKRKHLRFDCESANLPFGADNLKLNSLQIKSQARNKPGERKIYRKQAEKESNTKRPTPKRRPEKSDSS